MKWLLTLLLVIIVITGLGITDKVKRIAEAIATAEGFYAPKKNGRDPLPRRANNPGDLKNGDIGYGTIDGKTIYPSIEAGWSALYKQVTLMLTGLSKYYKPDMSLLEVAETYTGKDAAETWAQHAAEKLGVTPETKLSEVL